MQASLDGSVHTFSCSHKKTSSLRNPLSSGYANRYGIPAGNVSNANFIEAATLKPRTPFITRPALGIGANVGRGIEVVVPSAGVQMKWFTGMP